MAVCVKDNPSVLPFVTEAEVDCVSGILVGAAMYLSLPLRRILSVGELSAVVLHELSHLKDKRPLFLKNLITGGLPQGFNVELEHHAPTANGNVGNIFVARAGPALIIPKP